MKKDEFKMKEITYSEYQHILIPPYEKSLQIEFSVCEFFSIFEKKNRNFLKKKKWKLFRKKKSKLFEKSEKKWKLFEFLNNNALYNN